MNNNEFHDRLSQSLGYTVSQTAELTAAVSLLVTRELQEGRPVFVPSFGTFIVSKTLERIVQNPETGERSLVPPRLEAQFVPNAAVEEGATSLHDLSCRLAAERKMETTDAEEFVRAFFLLIRIELKENSYVNVSSLGTFRKIEDAVTFAPCKAVGDAINRPFSDFEPVALGEKVELEEAPQIEPVITLVEDDSDDSALSSGTVSFELDLDKIDTPKLDEEPAAEGGGQDYGGEQLTPVARRTLSLPWNMIASILFAGILIGGFSVWLMMRPPRPVTAEVPEEEVTVPADAEKPAKEEKKAAAEKKASAASEAKKEKAASETKKTTAASEAKKETASETKKATAASEAKKETAAETKKTAASSDSKTRTYSDRKSYRIAGTKATHTVSSGESLASISRKYYGNSNMWKYIVENNESLVKNPDNLKLGITLDIPELEEE